MDILTQLPVQSDRDLYKAVLDYGGTQIRYTEYPGVAHNVWDYVANETTLNSWLLAQRKGSVHTRPDGIRNFTVELLADNIMVHLQWDLPSGADVTQDNKVWYCRIYRNSKAISEVYNDRNSYIDSTSYGPADYEYKITAVNFYFKESVPSQSITITSKGAKERRFNLNF